MTSPSSPLPCGSGGVAWQEYHKARWLAAFDGAISLLPPGFLNKAFGDAPDVVRKSIIGPVFYLDSLDWATGFASMPISINLLPTRNGPEWMNWEPFIRDGFSKSEMWYVALHEIGHLYHFSHLKKIDSAYTKIIRTEKKRPTLYARAQCYDEETYLGACMEDWADVFMLTLLNPKYLIRYYPLRYRLGRSVFGKQPSREIRLTSSLIRRLAPQ